MKRRATQCRTKPNSLLTPPRIDTKLGGPVNDHQTWISICKHLNTLPLWIQMRYADELPKIFVYTKSGVVLTERMAVYTVREQHSKDSVYIPEWDKTAQERLRGAFAKNPCPDCRGPCAGYDTRKCGLCDGTGELERGNEIHDDTQAMYKQMGWTPYSHTVHSTDHGGAEGIIKTTAFKVGTDNAKGVGVYTAFPVPDSSMENKIFFSTINGYGGQGSHRWFAFALSLRTQTECLQGYVAGHNPWALLTNPDDNKPNEFLTTALPLLMWNVPKENLLMESGIPRWHELTGFLATVEKGHDLRGSTIP